MNAHIDAIPLMARYGGVEGALWDERISTSWHTFRIVTSSITMAAGIFLAAFWGWWGGLAAAALAAFPITDAIVTLRLRRSSPIFSIWLDTTLIGVAMVVVQLDSIAVGAPLLYMVLVATLFLSFTKGATVSVYALGWSLLAVAGFDIVPMPSGASTGVIDAIAYLIFAGHIVALLATIARGLEQSASARTNALHQLEEAARSKDQFVASISHEIRTPLTSVIGFADLLTEQDLNRDVFEMADMISREANEVSHIVEDLLVAARADLGTITLNLARIDVRSEIDAAIVGLAGRSDELAVGGDSAYAVADASRVRQITRVLLTNALRYGGPNVKVEIMTSDSAVRVEIRDDGPGIPEGAAERIFEPYHRAHSAAGQPQAIGLGLYVARHLSQLMGGDLTYGRADGFTVFRLTLPSADPADFSGQIGQPTAAVAVS